MKFLRRTTLTQWILFSMVLGVAIGVLWPGFAEQLKPLSNVFLRMIKSIIVPIIFSTLVVGIAGHGDDMKRVGRLAFRSILYFEIVTTLGLVVGLLGGNIIKPGRGVELGNASTKEAAELATTHPTLTGVLEHTVPTSFFDAAA